MKLEPVLFSRQHPIDTCSTVVPLVSAEPSADTQLGNFLSLEVFCVENISKLEGTENGVVRGGHGHSFKEHSFASNVCHFSLIEDILTFRVSCFPSD